MHSISQFDRLRKFLGENFDPGGETNGTLSEGPASGIDPEVWVRILQVLVAKEIEHISLVGLKYERFSKWGEILVMVVLDDLTRNLLPFEQPVVVPLTPAVEPVGITTTE
ncbi:hypothetical protein ACFPPE_06895 [Agromyces tardus]|uniref:hypothetical protein n=1 Tax=Agromyces tardus TaxID=2583849 RepID=UPI0036195835